MTAFPEKQSEDKLADSEDRGADGGKNYRTVPLPVEFLPVNPWHSTTLDIQQRRLPHVSAMEATYFVTFRCRKGISIPKQARNEVLSAILHWNGKRLDLDAAVVMPDHVHIVFRLISDTEDGRLEARPTVGKMLHSIKSFSSKRVNEILGRKGPLWMGENFDHIVRDGDDWQEKVSYIVENPLKKELVDKPELYEWLWIRKDNA